MKNIPLNQDKQTNHLRFSIVLPTRNRAKSVVAKIKQLQKVNYPPSCFEIIVVDNNSTDNTVPKITLLQKKFRNLNLLIETRIGPSFARNTGLKQAKYKHVIFTDDDVFAPITFLLDYEIAWKEHPQATALGGKMTTSIKEHHLNDSQKKLLSNYGWCFGQLDLGNQARKLEKGEILFTGNMSVCKTTKNDPVIHFNEYLGKSLTPNVTIFAEDYELCLRIQLLNRQIWYIPTINHKHVVDKNRFTSKYVSKRYFLCGLELFIMDKLLKKQFPITYQTYGERLKMVIKRLIRHQDFHLLFSYCHSKYDLLLILSYLMYCKFL